MSNESCFCTSYALVYAAILPQLQEIAQDHGYALAVHGSMASDLDLIACPWTKDVSDPEVLINSLCEYLGGIFKFTDTKAPTKLPHGRQRWQLFFNPDSRYDIGAPYVDISVMPRRG